MSQKPSPWIVFKLLVWITVIDLLVTSVNVTTDDDEVPGLPQRVCPDVQSFVEVELVQFPVRLLRVGPGTVDVDGDEMANQLVDWC